MIVLNERYEAPHSGCRRCWCRAWHGPPRSDSDPSRGKSCWVKPVEHRRFGELSLLSASVHHSQSAQYCFDLYYTALRELLVSSFALLGAWKYSGQNDRLFLPPVALYLSWSLCGTRARLLIAFALPSPTPPRRQIPMMFFLLVCAQGLNCTVPWAFALFF